MDRKRRDALIALGPAAFIALMAVWNEWNGQTERAQFQMLAAIFGAVVWLGAQHLRRD
jgi:hypothetical protein